MIAQINRLLESQKTVLIMFVIVIIGVLYAGLRNDIPTRNQVAVSLHDGSLIFGERGLAYSRQNLNEILIDQFNLQGFEVRLSFSPVSYENNSFQFLMLLTNGKANEQFVIAQFRDHIIIMNGDDYNYSKKSPRISIRIKDRFKGFQQLKLTVSKNKTTLVLNGQKAVHKKNAIVSLPNTKQGVRLLLSGSELLENNWRGAMKSFSIRPLLSDQIERFLVSFTADQQHVRQKKIADAVKLLAQNQSANWLVVPEKVKLLKHNVLEEAYFKINSKSALIDMLINFFGFIPFGFLLAALMIKLPVEFKSIIHKNWILLVGVFLCSFLLSFIIEYRQAWLVTRHSSLRDLYLNTLGGAAGAFFYIVYVKVALAIKQKKIVSVD